MKIKVFNTVALLILVFVLTTAQAEIASTITRDVLVSQYGLEDSDLLDEFIADYSLTEEYLEKVNIKQVYQNYLLRKYLEKYDFSYLLHVDNTKTINKLNSDNISRILWFWNPDSMIQVRLYDLKENKLFFGDSNFLPDILRADSRDLLKTEIDEIIDLLNQYNVLNWQECYPSSVNNTTGYLYWRIVIEFNDGSYFVSYGSGSNADNLPKEYSQVLDLLQRR